MIMQAAAEHFRSLIMDAAEIWGKFNFILKWAVVVTRATGTLFQSA